MNTIQAVDKNISKFFHQIVAGVKKGITFALPITTRTTK